MASFATLVADLITGTNFSPEQCETLFQALGERDTWTPTLQDSTLSNAEGQTYTEQTGVYGRMGDFVEVTGAITVSSLGTLATGDQVRIAGLPYGIDLTRGVAGFTVRYSGTTLTSFPTIGGSASENVLLLYKAGTNASANVTFADLGATTFLQFTARYFTTD